MLPDDAFTILQRRDLSASSSFCLSPTVDLCASADGNLTTINRILTWERVIASPLSQKAVAFSPCGQVLVGGTLDIVLLHVETGLSVTVPRPVPCSDIVRFGWFNSRYVTSDLFGYSAVEGMNSLLQDVMVESSANANGRSSDAASALIMNALKDMVLLCFCENSIEGYMLGLVRLFAVPTLDPHYPLGGPSDPALTNPYGVCCTSTVTGKGGAYSLQVIKAPIFIDSKLFQRQQELTQLWLNIGSDLGRLCDAILSLEKKWAGINKTLLAKLGLLDVLLQGYEIHMSSLEFYYTIALCGRWHPAVAAHFSQHWNEQGLFV